MSKEKGKIKIRFFEVELEGSDETLLESVKSAAALANRSQVRVTKLLAPVPGDGAEEEQAQETVGVEEEAKQASSTTERPKRRRAFPSPSIVDVELKDGEMPFAEFAELVKPSDITKKYLTVAVWFKRYRNTPKITIDHVWTCSRAMNWGVQDDMNQPLRDGKRNGYFKGTAAGYEVTHIGEGVIDKLLTSVK